MTIRRSDPLRTHQPLHYPNISPTRSSHTVSEALLAADDVKDFERRTADPYAPEAGTRHELHWQTKTGELRVIEWCFTAIPSPDGGLRMPYLLGTGSDITERRIAAAC